MDGNGPRIPARYVAAVARLNDGDAGRLVRALARCWLGEWNESSALPPKAGALYEAIISEAGFWK